MADEVATAPARTTPGTTPGTQTPETSNSKPTSSKIFTTEDIQTAAQKALEGLNVAKSINLDKLLSIEREFKWCSYYIYGMDMNAIGSNPSDPRHSFKQTKVEQCEGIDEKICVTYADFAGTYKPECYFLYLKPTGDTSYELNVLNVEQCDEIIVNLLSAKNEHEIDCIMAGMKYFGKLDHFKSLLKERNMNGEVMSKIYEYNNTNSPRYVNMIEQVTLLGKKLGISSTYFEVLGGSYFRQKSFTPTALIKEYKEYNAKYQEDLAAMMEILENTPSLQLCWANAENKEIEVGNNEDSAIGVSSTAMVNCMSDAVVDGFLNGATLQDVTVEQIYTAIDNLEARNEERTAELKTKLLMEQESSNKKNIIIVISISVCIIVLLIFCLIWMYKKINTLQSKMNLVIKSQL